MSSRANHFKLGLFVLAGLGTALLLLLLLGVGRTFRQPLLVETYLDQSVQGLEVGSKVKYRGVHLGSVHSIGFSRDRYEVGRPAELQRTYILIDVAVADEAHRASGREAFLEMLKADVTRGLRFRLNAQGITGLSFLELDYVDPYRAPQLDVTWTPEHLYIPSAPGTLTKLLSSAEQVFQKLEDVDLALLLNNLNRVLTSAEAQIRDAQLADIARQATNLLAELRSSNASLHQLLSQPDLQSLPASLTRAVEDLRHKIGELDLDALSTRLDRVLTSADTFFAGKETDLAATLDHLRAVTANLRALSEIARLHPSSLLLGAPPKPLQPSP